MPVCGGRRSFSLPRFGSLSKAMDAGWRGPPYDPLALAESLGMRIEARGDIPDARTVPIEGGGLLLEYNPMRPKGRLRFSIAHEVAHFLFPDCADEIRNRGLKDERKSDNWQLEVLCNIGAAELLMPHGSFSQLAEEKLSIDSVMRLRKEFEVSVEACLIRLVKLARSSCAAFGASKHSDGQYRIDYVIPASGWECPVSVGQLVPEQSAVADANAIGYVAKGDEAWSPGFPVRVECIGLAPYPGGLAPRVVGLLLARGRSDYRAPEITEVTGNALQPHGTGQRIIAHVVPDTHRLWGGGGFAAQVRRNHPSVWTKFKSETTDLRKVPRLGETYTGTISDEVTVVHMVAQRGIGPSPTQRLQYAALSQCLKEVGSIARKRAATVHMPRIGTGHGGAAWDVVRELVIQELVDEGVPTTVYDLPIRE